MLSGSPFSITLFSTQRGVFFDLSEVFWVVGPLNWGERGSSNKTTGRQRLVGSGWFENLADKGLGGRGGGGKQRGVV